MAAERPFEGKFLFINHDATQMKASVHRPEVFSHVQNNYRRWKRQEDNRALKASIKSSLPELYPSGNVEGRATQHSARTKDDRSISIRSTQLTPLRGEQTSRKITIRSLVTEDESEATRPTIADARLRILSAQTQSPDSILKKGNSDPFNAYPVRIDPTANDMLGFYRDVVLPALYHTAKHKSMTSTSAREDWQTFIYGWGESRGLGDEGAATAFIATCAAVAAVVSGSPTVQKQASHYRSKTVTLLRDRLAAGTCSRSQIYWHINTISDAETLIGNKVGAVAHLNMLRHLFERDGDTLDYGLLLHATYHDSHISAMFLSRPVFDVDRYLPEKLKPLVDAAMPFLPDFSNIRHHYLDPSIDNPKLQILLIERRENMAVWLARNGSNEESKSSLVVIKWLQVRAYLHQGRLVNLFLQAEARYKAGLLPQHMNCLTCQGYISLATLLYIRSISFNATVYGVRLFDATTTILTNMQEMLKSSEEPGFCNYEKYENARLWALYVGACAEMFRGMAPDKRGWFTSHFGKKAIKLRLDGKNAWDDVRMILKGFLYTDLMHPGGDTWYLGVLRTAKESEDDIAKGL